jgi:hypothetical protein
MSVTAITALRSPQRADPAPIFAKLGTEGGVKLANADFLPFIVPRELPLAQSMQSIMVQTGGRLDQLNIVLPDFGAKIGADGSIMQLVNFALTGSQTGNVPLVRKNGTLNIAAASPFFGIGFGRSADQAINNLADRFDVKVNILDTVSGQTYSYPRPIVR